MSHSRLQSVPRLETERLKLRAIFPADAAELFQIYSDPEVVRFYEFEPFVEIQQAQEFISRITYWFQNDIAVRWAVIRKSDGRLIGTCCFDTFNIPYHSCNLGYNLLRSEWGNGFATEFVNRIVDFAFDKGIHGPVNRIRAITVPENLASEAVLVRAGFEKEGTLREFGFWKNQYHDMNLFSRIKPKSATS